MFYYQFVVVKDIRNDLNGFRERLYKISEQTANRIQKDYPDHRRIVKAVTQVASKNKLKFSVFDINGNKIASADYRKDLGVSVELKNFTVVGKNNLYILELSCPFSIVNFIKFSSVVKLRDFSLLFVFFLLIIMTLYLHISLTKPLTLLHQGIERVNYRNIQLDVPLSLKRNDEVGDLGRKFEEMLERLEASRQEQTEMIASISHDLKTPLTSILGYMERLLSGKIISPEKQQEYYRIIQQKAQDMKEMITEFAEYAFNDADREGLSMEPVLLRKFCQDLSLEYTAELEGYGVTFESQIDIPEDFTVMIDIGKMRRVFSNLVQNALKYAEGMNRILFTCHVVHNFAVITFEDNGRGIPSEELGAIFKKFYRIDKSRSREKGGCGLGLAICQSIVESHGGQIEAAQGSYGGLKITLTIPAKSL